MAVKALYDYDFPSADRAELFGDDQLVYVQWRGNPLFCTAACFRAPRAMPFGEFKAAMVDGWAGSDPDYDPAAPILWRLAGQSIDPDPATSLAELGVGHKALLSFAV